MNNQIFFFFYNLAHQSKLIDYLIIFFAVYFPYIVVILAGLFLLFHHEVLRAESPARVLWEKKREILTVLLPGVGAWAIAFVLKNLIGSPRPFLTFNNVTSLFAESGFAFPSGHATFYSALAFSIFFLHKKAGYAFMFFALLIGLARITAGVHFPFDILGGYILGFIVSFTFDYFLKKYSRIL
ncbi:MAG: phosphatase PAP2 family protein [Candidatus Paceibacterota bacterium]|jgi:undecaprenyl-diphosphatase